MAILFDPYVWIFIGVTVGFVGGLMALSGTADLPSVVGLIGSLVLSLFSSTTLPPAPIEAWPERAHDSSMRLVMEQFMPARAECQIMLGFALLEAYIGPSVVGTCLEPERFDPVSDTSEQRTTGGHFVWHKRTGALSFTDGYRTWILGPHGVQKRLNMERYCWEDPSDPLRCIRIPR